MEVAEPKLYLPLTISLITYAAIVTYFLICRINIPIIMKRKPPPRPMKIPAVILSTKKPKPIPIKSPAGMATPVIPHPPLPPERIL